MQINLNLLFQLSSGWFTSKDSRLLHVLHSYLREHGYDASKCERRATEFYFRATSHIQKPLIKILMAFTVEYPTIRLDFQENGDIFIWGVIHDEVSAD